MHFQLASLLVEIAYEPVGCFKDRPKSREFKFLVKDFRKILGKDLWRYWPDMSLVVQRCAEDVFRKGYTHVFGVQFYGECYSDDNPWHDFTHGYSNNCISGVGKHWTNFIYRFKGMLHLQMTTL